MFIQSTLIKLINPECLPVRGSEHAAAFDCFPNIQQDFTMLPGEERIVGLGFALALPAAMCALLIPRSGMGAKTGVVISNLVGLIDQDFRGEVTAALWYRRDPDNENNKPVLIARKTRIVQILFIPSFIPQLEQVCDFTDKTARGESGFGHTGGNAVAA